MRLQLAGGAYAARSIIANGQRCINLYPERNRADAPVQITHYQRAGLKPLITPPANAPVRNIYRASNGNGYCTIGSTVYSISRTFQLTALGSITAGRTNPVSMSDNGVDIGVVDGSGQAWLIHMSNNAFSQWSDPTGLMRGGDRIEYIDTFLIMNVAGGVGNEWISTISNSTSFVTDSSGASPRSTAFAFKTGYPDPLVSLIVNHNFIVLLGALKSEFWFNAGLQNFPFAMQTGSYIEHGLQAKYSLACIDLSVYFLGQDLYGQGVVFKVNVAGDASFSCRRVSNHAIEFAIRKMASTVGTDDAVGYCYQQDGHFFYALHFPRGNQTWVLDDAIAAADPTNAWHQECWTDADGNLQRHRGNCHGFVYGKNLVGDHSNGMIYAMDLDTYTDTVAGVVSDITCIRTFQHVSTGEVLLGVLGRRPILAEGRRVRYAAFALDLECGMAPNGDDGRPPQVILRYSDDRGRTYSGDVLQSAGELGEYLTQPLWRGLGIARDRVFEVEFAARGPSALNGAWVDGDVLES